MGFIKKLFVFILIFLTINIYMPTVFGPGGVNLYADEIITKHPLEIRKTPGVEMTEKEEQVKSNWLLLGLLGAALVGGVAAIAGGGDDSGGDDDPDPTGGSIVGSW
jgi:hypothetical protein